MPGREVVVLGSGDIGMIMARRMTLEGARVKAVLEIMPFSTGLIRNKVQCLDDFNVPLKFNHTITRIEGGKRVEGVTVAQVDKNSQVIPETEEEISCDTILLSIGLIPENELTREAGIKLDPVTRGGEEIVSITGNDCPKGIKYTKGEFINPLRILPTTVEVIGGEFPLVSVKTEKAIPKKLLLKAMAEIAEIEVKAPVDIGQVVKDDLIGTGVSLVATRNIKRADSNLRS